MTHLLAPALLLLCLLLLLLHFRDIHQTHRRDG